MKIRKKTKRITILLALTLCLSMFITIIPSFAFADGEELQIPKSEEENDDQNEETRPVKTEEDFLTDGVFDIEQAYEYYLTLTEEEQTAFLESLSEENSALLMEKLSPEPASGTEIQQEEEEIEPDDVFLTSSEEDPEEGTTDGETDPDEAHNNDDPDTESGEEEKTEEEDTENEPEEGEGTKAIELELRIDDVITFDEAESITTTRSCNALEIEDNTVRAVNVTDEPVLLTVDENTYRIKVTKASLAVFLIDGQSNAAGTSGAHDAATVVPAAGNGYYWKDGALKDLKSVVKAMEKSAPDASVGFWPALAAEWYSLTGDKAVIINVAHNGMPIQNWASGYTSSGVQTLHACLDSIDTDKYTVTGGGYFWLQGESNSDPDEQSSNVIYATAPEYASAFEAVHNAYISAFSSHGITAFGGILSVRSWNSYAGRTETSEYCGPRAAQQYLANRYGDLFMASVLTDSWKMSDSSSFSFTAQSGNYSVSVGSISSLFCGPHYSQKAYNMLGLDAADGIWNGWLGGNSASNFTLYGYDGVTAIKDKAVIMIEDHMLITGAANIRERKAAQLTVVPTPRHGACGGVIMKLTKASDGSEVNGVMENCGYFPDISAIREELVLKVTMGSKTKTYTIKRETYKISKGTVSGKGSLQILDENGKTITKASSGDTILLRGKPDDGYLQTEMTVTNVKTGLPVPVIYEGNEDGYNRYSLTMPASEIRVSAKFIKPGTDNIGYSYRITFHKNAEFATGSMKTVSGKITATATIPLNSFGYKGFRFTGWNTEPDGTGVPVANGEKLSNIFFYNDQSLDFYAQWAKESYDATVSNGVMTLQWKAEETVFIDGVSHTADENGAIQVTVKNPKILTVYTFNKTGGDEHERYPTGMKVYVFAKKSASEYSVDYMERFDDILRYAGSSIRITGNKGIRMITGVPESVKKELAGKGIDGYTLLEYGTVVQWDSKLNGADLTLETPGAKSNYAYKKDTADPVFATSNGVQQYTNVLVGFYMDQCIPDLTMRAYMKLKAPDGSTVVIYGGTVRRSIGYIAWQNRNAFSSGSASYRYIWDIIHHVYGNRYDSEYKG